MKVYEAIADIVERERVEAVFAVLGDANMKWLSAFTARTGVPVVYARHEGSAIGMADGYTRATGKLAVCSVTCGPGVSLLATTLVAASRNRSPLVVIAGGAPRADKYYEQAFDQRRFVEACEAIAEDLRAPEHLDEDLRDAFYLARTVGPVVFTAPFDVQELEAAGHDAAYAPSLGLLTEPCELAPDPAAVRRAADLVAGSRRPLIVAGRGAIGARRELLELADATGALLATSMKAKGLFDGDPRDLGLAGGLASEPARARFAEADCVVGAGAGLNHYTIDHGHAFPAAKIVHISEDALGLLNGRRRPHHHPGGRRVADCYLRGSTRPAARALVEALGRTDAVPTWAAGVTELPRPELTEDETGLHPAAAIAALNAAAHPQSRFVIALGHHWWFALTYLRGRWDADAFQLTTEFGSIGEGFAAAIGSAIGRPDRKHVLVEGDGSFFMALQELDTAVRYGVDLLIVVMNDRGLGAEALKLDALGFDASAARIDTPDLGALATQIGGAGIRVSTLDQLAEATREYQATGGVCLVDVQISQRVMSAPYIAKLGTSHLANGATSDGEPLVRAFGQGPGGVRQPPPS
jgi:acetolactate synthase-1/2/3 large subunit